MWLLAEQRRTLARRDTALVARLRERLQSVLARHAPGTTVWIHGSLVKPGWFHEWSDVDLAFESLSAAMSLQAAAGNATRCVGKFEGWCREFVATVRNRDRDVFDA